jgi:hypothetical protein
MLGAREGLTPCLLCRVRRNIHQGGDTGFMEDYLELAAEKGEKIKNKMK